MALRACSPQLRRGTLGAVCVCLLLSLLPHPVQAQEVPGRRLPDIYINARFNDGYWEWYEQYLRDRDAQRARTTEIRLQLAVIAAERKKLRAQWLKLLYDENRLMPQVQYSGGWSLLWSSLADITGATEAPVINEAMGISSSSAFAEEVGAQIHDIASRWTLGVWGAPLAPRDPNDPWYEAATPETERTAAIEVAFRNQRDQLRTDINQWKEQQGELILEALELNQDLSASCLAQKEKSGDRRPRLNEEIVRLKNELAMLEVYLYDAAEWYLPDELPALVEALDLDNTATEEVALLLRAKVKLHEAAWNDEKNWLQMTSPRQAPPDPEWVMAARAPRLAAIVDLRRVLELNPENAEARGMLSQVELYWLREIASKVDLESRASVRAFRQYISARGFYADQPEAWYQDAWEIITAVWGLGPIALTSGIPGLNVAEARATELDVTQTQAARNQVALLSIMRLVKNGVPLAEIPTMSPDEVARHMTMHTAGGRPLPPDKVSRVVQDIRDTFRDLDDLRLLASADPEYLVEDVNKAYGKMYFAPLDPTYTWYESFGDLLNLHNVTLLWGPGSLAKVWDPEKGKFVWNAQKWVTPSQYRAMEQLGIQTTKQVAISTFGLDKLAQTVAKTRVGSWFMARLAADREAMTAGGALMNLANMGARLASAVVLYSGATYLGQQNGIPGAGLLVEIIGELGPVDMLSDIAMHAQVPTGALKTRVGEFGEYLQRQADDLTTAQARSAEVAGFAEELAEGTVDVQRQATINNRLNEIIEETGQATRPPGAAAGAVDEALPTMPGAVDEALPTAAGPVDEAVGSAARALLNDDLGEARQALAGAAELAETASTQLDEAAARVAAVQAMLEDAAEHSSLQIARPEELKKLYEIWAEPKYWRPDLYADTGAGLSLKLADEAQRNGDLAGAYRHLRAAKQEILAVERNAANAQQVDALTRHISRRLDDVVNAGEEILRMQRLQRNVPASNASDPIEADQAAQALAHLDQLEAAGTQAGGSANAVLPVQDAAGNWYYAKRIIPERGNKLTEKLTPKDIEEILSGEAASYSLAQKVDEIERSLAPTPDGSMPGDLGGLNAPAAVYDPVRKVLLTRAIPREAMGLAGELWELPEYVAIAYRKEYARQRVLRAWLGDADGHLRNMFRGDDGRLYQLDFDQATLSGKPSRLLSGASGSAEEFMEAMLITPSMIRPMRNGELQRMVGRMDQEITYADMASTVAAIQELVADPEQLKAILTQAGYKEVEAAVQTLTERAALLEPKLKRYFDGELLRIGVASIARHADGWLARLPGRPLPHFVTRTGRRARVPTRQIESLPMAA